MARSDREVAIYTAYEDFPALDPAMPEKNLLRALLVTAMADVKKTGQIRKRALDYFFSTNDDYAFSFEAVCDYLDIDPQSVLATVKRLDKGAQDKNKEA